MSQYLKEKVSELETRVTELEEAIVQAVAEIDQADGSRIGLQEAMDSVRTTFETAYGEALTDDVNEYLGIDNSDDEEDESSEEDE
jgi:hypothetical protein